MRSETEPTREEVERLVDDLGCSTAPIKNQAAWMLRELRRQREKALEDMEAVWEAMPKGSEFLDPPDGGDVPLHEQVRRVVAALSTLREERDAFEKMAAGMSADLTAFHSKVAAALDPEHHLCIRDDDWGGQYADPIEVITEMRSQLSATSAELERVREGVMSLTGYDESDEENPSEIVAGPGRFVLRADVLALFAARSSTPATGGGDGE